MRAALLAGHRFRGPAMSCAIAVTVGLGLAGVLGWRDGTGWLAVALVGVAVAVVLSCGVLMMLGPRLLPDREPAVVRSPVRGRWLALNSPASRVPSHGVRMYGQSFAIDLVAEPVVGDSGQADEASVGSRPVFGDGPGMRASTDYPAFGEPVFAMVSGTVVRASDWRRDHRARSGWLAMGYLMVESAIRELGGQGFIIGNHVTIRDDEGRYALVAHLQRGSVAVAVGDTVRAGDRIASCGNSGNSSEPHVHAQLMDRAVPWVAQGLPMAFREVVLAGRSGPVDGLPANAEHLTAAR